MNDESRIDPKHAATRNVLRVLGPVVGGLGILFTAIGIGNFFYSFGSFEPPRYFWCAFVGMPLMFFGGAMTQYGYLGAWARYVAGEGAPVAKDAFNYLAEGTRPGVRNIAQAVGEGLAAARTARGCPRCQQANDSDARFCKHCGAALSA